MTVIIEIDPITKEKRVIKKIPENEIDTALRKAENLLFRKRSQELVNIRDRLRELNTGENTVDPAEIKAIIAKLETIENQ